MTKIEQHLRALMEENGLTVALLAERVGRTVDDVENGLAGRDLDVALRVMDVLGLGGALVELPHGARN